MAPSPETAPPDKNNSPPSPSSDQNQSDSPPPTSSPPSNSSSSSPPPSSPPPSSPPPSSPPPSSPPPSENPPPKESPPSSSPPPTTPTASPPPSTPTQSPPPSGGGLSPPSPPSPTNPTTPTSPPSIFSPPTPATHSTPPSAVTGSPPAPHGPAHKSPGSSGSSGSSTTTTPPSSSSSPSSNTMIIGVAIGGILILIAIIICTACSMRKKKRQAYYMDSARPPKGNDYMYNGSQLWNNSPQSVEGHVVKLPPPPGVMGTPLGGGGGWAAPPPPPLAMNGSDYSSGYSGPPHTPLPPPSPNVGSLGHNQSTFTYEELAAATDRFSHANLLGQGGFGYVHKGVLPNGKEVAVKCLKAGSGQGEREFQAEVEIISRVHHRHLVSLVGYCMADGQRLLVYEFVANKTLEFHLHGKGQPTMDWATRLRIALGSAKGFAYLHEDCHPRIIHRDIKAANILLDENYEAMVADFGLAKLSSDNYTHVSTRIMGTFGYLAPEYASSGKLSEKSDVFSYGVMLLELITGRRPVDPTSRIMEDSLVDWARPLLTRALEDGNFDELVDPRLENNFDPHEMARMAGCASASIRHSARRRPKMSQIVRALEGDSSLEDLNEVTKTIGQSSVYSTNLHENKTTGGYDTGAYNADMLKFRKMVMSSEDYASSDFGATSEYGLNPSSSSGESRENSGIQRQKP